MDQETENLIKRLRNKEINIHTYRVLKTQLHWNRAVDLQNAEDKYYDFVREFKSALRWMEMIKRDMKDEV